MSRSSTIMLFLILFLLSLHIQGVHCSLEPRGASCKAFPGTSDWPSPETWASLNTTTEGRLLQPVPPGAVCHPAQPNYDATLCYWVQYYWGSEYFHDQDPVSAEWNNWTNDSCLPDPKAPCSSEGYPVYVINATDARHVKAGIEFGKFQPFQHFDLRTKTFHSEAIQHQTNR